MLATVSVLTTYVRSQASRLKSRIFFLLLISLLKGQGDRNCLCGEINLKQARMTHTFVMSPLRPTSKSPRRYVVGVRRGPASQSAIFFAQLLLKSRIFASSVAIQVCSYSPRRSYRVERYILFEENPVEMPKNWWKKKKRKEKRKDKTRPLY